jgi:hypothetical protein
MSQRANMHALRPTVDPTVPCATQVTKMRPKILSIQLIDAQLDGPLAGSPAAATGFAR